MKQSLFITEMHHLLTRAPLSFLDLAQGLRSKGPVFLALVAVLPFMQPIPIPGLSSLLGLIILLQGVSLVVGGKLILTQRMRETVLSTERIQSFVRVAEKVFPYVGWMVTPRGAEAVRNRLTQASAGLALIFLAGFLSLPLPIPLSNFLPAVGIFFLCLGLLEDDILLVGLGLVYTLVFGWMLFVLTDFLTAETMQSEWWTKLFG